MKEAAPRPDTAFEFCTTMASPECDELTLTRARCYACKLPSCTDCSRRVRWYGSRRRRVCRICIEDHLKGTERWGWAKRVIARIETEN